MNMYNNGYTTAPNQYFPMAAPGFQYGQIQPPYVPQPQVQPSYAAQTVPQPQQAPRIQMGRVVSSPNEISAQDVSQDGSMTLFPDVNGQVIYGRSWQPNGSITETRFITEQRQDDAQQADPFALIMDDLSDLKDGIDDLKKAMGRRQNHKPYRKNQNGSNESEGGEQDA